MVNLYQLNQYLEDFLSINDFEDCCPNGVQVEGKKEIKLIGTAVSASVKAIEKAIEQGCDALVVHHGIFWKSNEIRIKDTLYQKIKLLVDHRISLLAYHLPLDAHPTVGNNWKAAKDLGWENLKDFKGIGVIGSFPKISVLEFQKKLEDYYDHKAHIALGGERFVSSAAVISGGAYKCLLDAKKEGVDCFITGNFDEPAWHEAYESKINFFALGHFATEVVGPKALGEHLEEVFGVKTIFIKEQNPF